MAELAAMDGVTSWDVTLSLVGDGGDSFGLGAALSSSAGTAVSVKDVAGSLLSGSRFRGFVSVAFNGLDGLASMVGCDVAGYTVEELLSVEPVKGDLGAAAGVIQGVLRGRGARTTTPTTNNRRSR